MVEHSVSTRLRKAMDEQHTNCVQLAQAAKVKTSFLYDILNGKSANPSAVQLAKVAKALNISLSYLAGSSKLRADYPAVENNGMEYIPIARLVLDKHSGKIISQLDKTPTLQLSKAWLEEDLGISPADARYFSITSDEMNPLFTKGDTVLINTTRTLPSPPGIFLMFDGAGLTVRRVEYKGNPKNKRIRILSENVYYSPDERSLEDIFIIGRVIWVARAI